MNEPCSRRGQLSVAFYRGSNMWSSSSSSVSAFGTPINSAPSAG